MNWLKKLWKAALALSERGPEGFTESACNYSPRAQQVLSLAGEEAQRLKHCFVGTEHLLLGMIKLGQGCGVNVLHKMGLDLEAVRLKIDNEVGVGPAEKASDTVRYTPRVKKVLMLAAKEARKLNHTYVGTEHILLGLLCEGDCVGFRVLKSFGVKVARTRREVLRELDPEYPCPP